MKNIKIFGLLLAFCGMSGMVACDDGNENEGGGEFSASVNFANGSETWNAGAVDATDWEDGEVSFIFYKKADTYPAVEGLVFSSGKTEFPDAGSLSDYVYLEYYSEDYADRALSDEEGIPYGDWQVASGTVTVSYFKNSLMSGSMSLLMFDFYDYAINDNQTPEVKTLTVTFNNVPLSMGTRAMLKAYSSPDGKYVFKNKMPVRF